MQNRTCSRTVDQDVAVMLSPSKLAAERIYSTKRNSISFHAALQSGSPELALAAFEKPVQDTAPLMLQQFEKPVQDTVPLAIQKPTFPTLAQRSYPPVQEPTQDMINALYSDRFKTDDSLEESRMIDRKLANNQFQLVQQQIDLLRKVVAATGSPVPAPAPAPQPIVVTIPAPAPVTPVPVATASAAPIAIASLENNSLFLLLQKLIFAAIFIVGLLRIVEWLVEKATNIIVPDESDQEKPARPASRSASFSSRQ